MCSSCAAEHRQQKNGLQLTSQDTEPTIHYHKPGALTCSFNQRQSKLN